jgi:hypothetical protein
MTKKNKQYCSLTGLGRTKALRAQGRCGFNGNMGFGASQGRWRHGLEEDDGAAGPGTTQVDGVVGSGMAPGAQRHGLREDNVVACSGMVSWGRWQRVMGLDCGQER